MYWLCHSCWLYLEMYLFIYLTIHHWAVCLLSTFHGALCIFRTLTLWLSYCRYLFPVCGLPFPFFIGVIWGICAHGFNSPVYQMISSVRFVLYFCALKKSFFLLTWWVIKNILFYTFECFAFNIWILRPLEVYSICCKRGISFKISYLNNRLCRHHLFNRRLPLLLWSATVLMLYLKCPCKHVSVLSYLVYFFGLFVYLCIDKKIFFKHRI